MGKLTPIKAIRMKCLECSCGSFSEVKECLIKKCPLYAYRLGHRPKEEVLPIEPIEENKTADSPVENE